MSKDKNLQTNRPGGGGAAAAASDVEVLACLADIKTLIGELCEKIVLGDDSTALAEIIANLMQLCDKLLAQSDIQNEILAELQALCEKILAGNESLAEVVAELQALCTKLESVLEALEAICGKLDAVTTTAPCGESTGGGEPVGELVSYPGNFDTDTSFAIIGTDTLEITEQLPLQATSAAFIDAINACLAAGMHNCRG